MDIKPSNIPVNDNQDLILIDWEQSSATKWMRAPEIDRTLHAEETSSPSGSSKLIYTKYSSLPPQPNPDRKGVVDLWHEHCPKAVEKAEVYMLGKTMWMLLQQVTESEAYKAYKDDEGRIFWNERAEGVPREWKDVVGDCVREDPNERPGLEGLREYWGRMERMMRVDEEMEAMLEVGEKLERTKIS